MEKLKSEGKCIYCDKLFGKAGLSRHLSTHLAKLEKAASSNQKAFHLYIAANEMFLHVLVDGSTNLGKLDGFLRAIWLECCGHMSSFKVKGKHYESDWDVTEFGEPKAKQAKKVFQKGMKLDYEYDFGSTTYLEIRVINEYQMRVPSGISLMSRNEPLPILCHICEKEPAVAICSVCIYEGDSMFCESCAKNHEKTCSDFEDYARMEVVNSPRMGVCAYDGGQIDTERDGVWTIPTKKK